MHTAGPEEYYFTRLSEGEFEIQKCKSCAKPFFYPRVICPHCGSDNYEWFKPNSEGTIYSLTIVRTKEIENSYSVILVDLLDGVRLMATLVNDSVETAKIGSKVKLHSIDKENNKLIFTLA